MLVARLKELEKRKKELGNRTITEGSGGTAIEIDVPTMLAEYKEVKKSPASPAYKEFIRNFIDRIDVGTYSVKITLKTGLDIFPARDSTYEVSRQKIYERKRTG